MTTDFLAECKKGLNIPVTTTDFDGTLNQKLLAVKSYMSGAGVSDTMMEDALAVAVVVLGVTDLWNIKSGEVEFSPAFGMLVEQLAVRSL